MPDTPRSSFRLRAETLRRIEEIRQARGNQYGMPTRTRVIELAIERLHQVECPKEARETEPQRSAGT
jgi:hypothetical protein